MWFFVNPLGLLDLKDIEAVRSVGFPPQSEVVRLTECLAMRRKILSDVAMDGCCAGVRPVSSGTERLEIAN